MYDVGATRKATIYDLPKIIEIEQKCFQKTSAYTPQQLQYLLIHANSNCLIYQDNHTVQGFIIVLFRKRTEVAGIETINVDPQFQGKGIGKKLLFAAEDEMCYRGIRKIRLEVASGNSSAIQLYKKSGFRFTTLLKNYYQYEQHGSHDAIRMVKELTT